MWETSNTTIRSYPLFLKYLTEIDAMLIQSRYEMIIGIGYQLKEYDENFRVNRMSDISNSIFGFKIHWN